MFELILLNYQIAKWQTKESADFFGMPLIEHGSFNYRGLCTYQPKNAAGKGWSPKNPKLVEIKHVGLSVELQNLQQAMDERVRLYGF